MNRSSAPSTVEAPAHTQRTRRVLTGWLLAVVAALGLVTLSLGTTPAAAAASDSYDVFNVEYVVDASGVTHVKESFTYNFASSSPRHGYDRILVTGERYDDEQDIHYEISNITVSSPDPISTQWQRTDYVDGRNRSVRIRIGDPDETIASMRARYVITYDIAGALRPFADYDEFYWDALGPGLGRVEDATVTVTVPKGVKQAQCFAGRVGATTSCTASTIDADEVATFTESVLSAGDVLTVDTKITKGAAGSAQPMLVESADRVAQRQAATGAGVGLGLGVLVPLGTWLWARRNLPDERFVGLPPGVLPLRGDPAEVGLDRGVEIPVSFAPPALPLMDAGYLLEARSTVAHLTATLVGLATAGAIRLSSPKDGHPTATLVDGRRVPDAVSQRLFDELFSDGAADPVRLDEQGSLTVARRQLSVAAARDAKQGLWFVRTSPPALLVLLATAAVLALIGSLACLMMGVPAVAAALVPLGLITGATAAVLGVRARGGRRTAKGRALTDQVEGFRTYIATAEAEQLRFQEGEDIFTRYLPWAILFGLADRWTKVCSNAVQLGLLAEPSTAWYGGGVWDPGRVLWNISIWGDSIGTSTTPIPSPATSSGSYSGSGFGGGSGFSGGGFSGGGGGGGGGGGW